MRSFFTSVVFIVVAIHAQVLAQQIHFEQLEIIDTITVNDLDSNLQVAGDNKYVFRFTNIGKEPLIVGFTAGSDPDYNCDYSREPIAPGKSDFITICASNRKLVMDKYYTINDNSVTHQTIHIKRIFDRSDSTVYAELVKRNQERWQADYNYAHRYDVLVAIDSCPALIRQYADSTWPQHIPIDSTRDVFCVEVNGGFVSFRTVDRRLMDAPENAVFRYQDSAAIVYLDIRGNLLEERRLMSETRFEKSREHDIPFTRYHWKIVRYPPGKAPKLSEEIIDVPVRGYW